MNVIIPATTHFVSGRRKGTNTARNLSRAMNEKVRVETSKDTKDTELVTLHRRRPKVPLIGHSKPTNTMAIILGMLQTVMNKSAMLRLTIR